MEQKCTKHSLIIKEDNALAGIQNILMEENYSQHSMLKLAIALKNINAQVDLYSSILNVVERKK